ncbi:MAG TPA: pitrilysin family protein [Candidatus Nanoarchaeia archaeon]|nr:pitrilysin family protein [Candidatus Nanoarchaeia archaeon]
MKRDDQNYREFTLDNGLFVALQNTPTQTVSGRLRVFQGALHEQPGEEGLAHFLEHTIVNAGSRKYSPHEIRETMANFGYMNAFTSQSQTTYPVDMLSEDVETYLDLIADAVTYPRFDKIKVDEERQRILREIADIKSAPDFIDKKALVIEVFGKDSPHVYQVFGKEDIVTKATPDDLQRIHERGYHAANMDLILAGGLPENIEELVTEKLGKIPRGKNQKYIFPRNRALEENCFLHSSAPELLNRENPQASTAVIYLTFPVCTEGDEDYYAMIMLANFLCKSASSYLFNKLSRRMGIAYDIGGDYDYLDNKGLITIWGKIDASRKEEAFRGIFESMRSFQDDNIPIENLKIMTGKTKYHLAKTFESNSGHVGIIEAKLDRGFSPEQYFRELENVTPEQVQEAANKYLPVPDGKYVLLLRDPLKQ